MTKAQLAREITAVEKLSFVLYVDKSDKEVIVVNLIPPITQFLPETHGGINFHRDEFTVNVVMKAYKQYVVDHIAEALTLAEQLLRDTTNLNENNLL